MNIFNQALNNAKQISKQPINNLFKPASGLNIECIMQGVYHFHNVSGFKGEIVRYGYYDNSDIECLEWIVTVYDQYGDVLKEKSFDDLSFQDARLFASMFEG